MGGQGLRHDTPDGHHRSLCEDRGRHEAGDPLEWFEAALERYGHKHLSAVLAPIEAPLYNAEEILGVVPADLRTPYDIREVIARLADGSRFDEFKARFGETLVCGFAHVMGCPVGIVANNGILFSESALKGAHFIQLADRRGRQL